MSIDVRVDTTPNPNAIKFTAANKMFDGRLSAKKGDNIGHPLASKLLSLEGVDNIFGYEDFITVNKTFDADWDVLLPQIKEVFNDYK
ncbi:scaffold Nfu/NifU family protein [Scopulibacillus darangshiensis]|uniref:Scaffold Nfu/NifU family protein n=1 Tax=Scopulibacillus darangshiensis TaxID=442528 RepID=A0A4R2P6J0_9BACL|nr:NifU N-terminal domain-containing protein [Scopulibacillus darangshiensis]TCP29774.1 scaffold Nfu/NifU family protein [Scopulibacillus darangshiensis]